MSQGTRVPSDSGSAAFYFRVEQIRRGCCLFVVRVYRSGQVETSPPPATLKAVALTCTRILPSRTGVELRELARPYLSLVSFFSLLLLIFISTRVTSLLSYPSKAAAITTPFRRSNNFTRNLARIGIREEEKSTKETIIIPSYEQLERKRDSKIRKFPMETSLERDNYPIRFLFHRFGKKIEIEWSDFCAARWTCRYRIVTRRTLVNKDRVMDEFAGSNRNLVRATFLGEARHTEAKKASFRIWTYLCPFRFENRAWPPPEKAFWFHRRFHRLSPFD